MYSEGKRVRADMEPISLSIFAGTSSCLNGHEDKNFKVKCLYQNGTLILPEEPRRTPSLIGNLLKKISERQHYFRS